MSPEATRKVAPIPVTRWGNAEEGDGDISGVCLSQPQDVHEHPVIWSCIGYKSLVRAPHKVWHLEEVQGELESCQNSNFL